MNENTSEDVHFFGVELQLVQIADSAPAPLLNLAAQPNDWQKQVRAATSAGAITGKGALYASFWKQYLDRVKADHPAWTRARRTGPDNWLGMKSPLKNSQIVTSFAQGDRLRHYLYIDAGDVDANTNVYEFHLLTSLRGSAAGARRWQSRQRDRAPASTDGAIAALPTDSPWSPASWRVVSWPSSRPAPALFRRDPIIRDRALGL